MFDIEGRQSKFSIPRYRTQEELTSKLGALSHTSLFYLYGLA
jgi:hypothetical protein